jgi:hypothetical protein
MNRRAIWQEQWVYSAHPERTVLWVRHQARVAPRCLQMGPTISRAVDRSSIAIRRLAFCLAPRCRWDWSSRRVHSGWLAQSFKFYLTFVIITTKLSRNRKVEKYRRISQRDFRIRLSSLVPGIPSKSDSAQRLVLSTISQNRTGDTRKMEDVQEEGINCGFSWTGEKLPGKGNKLLTTVSRGRDSWRLRRRWTLNLKKA